MSYSAQTPLDTALYHKIQYNRTIINKKSHKDTTFDTLIKLYRQKETTFDQHMDFWSYTIIILTHDGYSNALQLTKLINPHNESKASERSQNLLSYFTILLLKVEVKLQTG